MNYLLTKAHGRVICRLVSGRGRIGPRPGFTFPVGGMDMLFPFSDAAAGVSEPPGDFDSNYRHLKQLINKAIKSGTPVEDLKLIRKSSSTRKAATLSRDDLLKLLHLIRSIKSRCQTLLEAPVPEELERDIMAKEPTQRLPWETEALEKAEKWRSDLVRARALVRAELNNHLKTEFFHSI